MKKWQILDKHPTSSKQQTVDEIIKLLLQNRGLVNKKEIAEFLNPSATSSLLPATLGIKISELKKAAQRIKKAIDDHESVVVYGDYDCDGVCATAIMWETLNSMGVKVMPYIPHRVEEGYGLSEKGIDNVLHEFDASLIITVDHGITAWEKVEYGKKLGLDFIICDHHVLPKKLPKAVAVIHTTQLCGAGVAWVLAQELIRHSGERSPAPSGVGRSDSRIKNGFWTSQNDDHLDLAAIATIADMVPLVGANRTLVKYGLEELNQTKRLGLRALIKEAGLGEKEIGVYEVSHLLAPRLNAMGRLEHAMDSLRLICTKDENRAGELAGVLNETNRERQDLTSETLLHAKNEHKRLTVVSQVSKKLIFLSHESFNQGIIGLVAGKLVEEFYRPAIVVAKGEEFSKGSCRSITGFNIIETLRKASDFLVDCGGHPMAAGFTVATKNLEKLRKKLEAIADLELDEEKLTRVLKIDCELELGQLNTKLNEALKQLTPFGLGNPEPVFCSRGVSVENARLIGIDGKHLRLKVSQKQNGQNNTQGLFCQFNAVAFGMGELLSKFSSDKPVDIAYTLTVNDWNNEKKLELKIKDIKTE